MYKRCVTEQSAQRQRQLTACLLSAMGTQSYDSISVSSLCQQMNIPRKSFYRYFSSKEGALYALIDNTILDFQGEIFSDTSDATLDTLEHFFDYWQQQSKFLAVLQQNNLLGLLIQRSIERSESDALISRKLQPFNYDFPPRYIMMFLISGLLSLVIQWHQDHYQQPSRKMATLAAHLLSQPMMTLK